MVNYSGNSGEENGLGQGGHWGTLMRQTSFFWICRLVTKEIWFLLGVGCDCLGCVLGDGEESAKNSSPDST